MVMKHKINRLLGIDELTNIDKKRKAEALRIIRSMGRNSIIFPLTGRSYTPELDKKYNEVIRKRLIHYMDSKNIDEVDMAIAPGIVGSDRYDLEHAFFDHHIKQFPDGLRQVYEPLVDGYEAHVWLGGMSIIRTKGDD